ncbi:bifunctional DNA-formamidopyrimidine glycosylase/DNA-(apurinic or apyrimidinic site) lyase [Actinobacteria bacterium YIM 96077]|uniref:Formamidopyrimidine-DNA glycosylase n=1 Tax=Phytoactinopolyspora halophila TaxID=1981511 RepID=A0A329QGY0_9ACTN|nr:bifunctional DNA-formamidopyrimidine glycosylase/DNA-(apurinic or apyrimidinic site) lyase [Phytoactinopolyspora halophila]AYY12708.1 bifunctional DNA-formamidopyrimidine glycosylase/DNA-(apurinic or apyrimidinic site) lyase [Actinobacteria bacterium YIM 96077]RAW10622.1 DNA-formamidopyrimidine glycosylase [Phytoactinopolyspora halophila]
MPELPEVEVVRLGLQAHVAGRRIARVEVLHPRSVRRHGDGAADFAHSLAGARLGPPGRRGKYLWLPVEDGGAAADRAILGHLGMSGQLLLQPPSVADEPHLRIRFIFDDAGPQLRFVDQRTFGGLAVAPVDETGLPAEIAHIAPDPLDPAFDLDTFTARVRRKKTAVKRALLDQSLISGIGNIYADEALWRARLHYARPTETLRRAEVARLVQAVGDVMRAALVEGGTSFDRLYVNVNGDSGYFERSLRVYGRGGEPCARCDTPIRRDPFMNRSSYTCPACQPRPRRARW